MFYEYRKKKKESSIQVYECEVHNQNDHTKIFSLDKHNATKIVSALKSFSINPM